MLAQQLLNGFVVGGVYALFALGFTLVFGIQRVLNLAHGAIFMSGAFIAFYTVDAGGPLWLGFILAVIGAGLLSILVEFVCFRRLRKTGDEEFGGIISSIGASLVIMTIAQRISDTQVLRFPFETFPVIIWRFQGLRVSALQVFMLAMAILLVVALGWYIYRTAFGRRVRAVTGNERAAKLMGINPVHVWLQTYFLSGALAGAAGVLVALAFSSIRYTMGEPYLMYGFVIIILGGLGSIPGALMASFLFGIAQTMLTAYMPSGYSGLNEAVIFAALFLLLLFRPHGLMGKEEAGALRGRR